MVGVNRVVREKTRSAVKSGSVDAVGLDLGGLTSKSVTELENMKSRGSYTDTQ